MAENTGIAWADHTLNFWWGCVKVSPACGDCYAAQFDYRLGGNHWGKDAPRRFIKAAQGMAARWDREAEGDRKVFRLIRRQAIPMSRNEIAEHCGIGWSQAQAIIDRLIRRQLIQPNSGNLGGYHATVDRWIPPRVFCMSMGDLFEVYDGPVVNHAGEALHQCVCGYIGLMTTSSPSGDRVCRGCGKWTRPATLEGIRQHMAWPTIRECPNLTFMLLTKRPALIPAMMPADLQGAPNIWLGATVESNAYRHRLDELLAVDAPVHFASNEPSYERVDFRDYLAPGRINWVITGGESKQGKDHQPSPYDAEWARSIIGQCRAAGVAPFVKQLGSNPVSSDLIGPHDPDRVPLRLKHPKGEDPAEWPEYLRIQEFPPA